MCPRWTLWPGRGICEPETFTEVSSPGSESDSGGGTTPDALRWPPRPASTLSSPLACRGPAPKEASLPHFAGKEIRAGESLAQVASPLSWTLRLWSHQNPASRSQPTPAEQWPPTHGAAECFKCGESTWRCAVRGKIHTGLPKTQYKKCGVSQQSFLIVFQVEIIFWVYWT